MKKSIHNLFHFGARAVKPMRGFVAMFIMKVVYKIICHHRYVTFNYILIFDGFKCGFKDPSIP